jgi:hypothetical protein
MLGTATAHDAIDEGAIERLGETALHELLECFVAGSLAREHQLLHAKPRLMQQSFGEGDAFLGPGCFALAAQEKGYEKHLAGHS